MHPAARAAPGVGHVEHGSTRARPIHRAIHGVAGRDVNSAEPRGPRACSTNRATPMARPATSSTTSAMYPIVERFWGISCTSPTVAAALRAAQSVLRHRPAGHSALCTAVLRVPRGYHGLAGPYHPGPRGVAQPGSALALGARGRGFESRRPDMRDRRTVRGAVSALLLSCSLALAGVGVLAASAPTPASAGATPSALLPDVILRPITEIRIQKGIGVKLLRFASIIGNSGAGVVELKPDSAARSAENDCDSDGDPLNDRKAFQRIFGDTDGDGIFTRGVDDGARQAVRRLFDLPRRAQPLALRGVRALPAASEPKIGQGAGVLGEGLVLRAATASRSATTCRDAGVDRTTATCTRTS